jgi:hypothetical protein
VDLYYLKGTEPVKAKDLDDWLANGGGNWPHRVARDHVGLIVVDTCFLGMDHSFGHGDPVLWETMVSGNDKSEIYRWRSLAEAIAGHKSLVAAAREPDDGFAA